MSEQGALTRIPTEQLPLEPAAQAPQASVTPAQAKIDAIANLTLAAYARASELQLSPEETAALQEDFPDDAFQPGAGGKEHLIYIQHAHLRDRFTKVFGMGQWAIIPRNRWAEDFTTAKGTKASRVYVEAMLVIRGCFCAEAIGEMEYYPNNAGQNYADAVEGAKTAALRRCAKELGVGLQAWKKEFGDGWWQRKRGGRPGPGPAIQQGPPPADPAKGAPAAGQAPPTTPPAKRKATEATREWLIKALASRRDQAIGYFQALKWLGPNQPLEQIALDHCPTSSADLKELLGKIDEFANGPATPPAAAAAAPAGAPPANGQEERWRKFKMPFGNRTGIPLEELEKKYLYGLWLNFVPKTEYNGRPYSPEELTVQQALRQMLDEAGEHYQFTPPGQSK